MFVCLRRSQVVLKGPEIHPSDNHPSTQSTAKHAASCNSCARFRVFALETRSCYLNMTGSALQKEEETKHKPVEGQLPYFTLLRFAFLDIVMQTNKTCTIQEFIQSPACSKSNFILFAIFIIFILIAGAVIVHRYWKLYQEARFKRAYQEHLRGRLISIDNWTSWAPPTRDRSLTASDDTSTPPPNPTSLSHRFAHFIRNRVNTLRTPRLSTLYPRHEPSLSSSSSSSTGSDRMYMAGDGVQRPLLGTRLRERHLIEPVEQGYGTNENIRKSVRDRSPPQERRVPLGNVREGTIAKRRRSGSSEIFPIDIDA